MKFGVIVAAAAALLVSGCTGASCGGESTNGGAAGACGIHTTFFAARNANPPAATLRKS